MTIISTLYTCPVCGNLREESSVPWSGRRLGEKFEYVDWNPPARCDVCNYVTRNEKQKLSQELKRIIHSAEYQSIFRKKEDYTVLNYLGMAFIEEHLHKLPGIIAMEYLNAAWVYEDILLHNFETDLPNINAKERFIKYIKKAIVFFQKSQKMNDKVILLDLYRQMGQFKKAKFLCKELKNKKKFLDICDLEEQMLCKHNTSPIYTYLQYVY